MRARVAIAVVAVLCVVSPAAAQADAEFRWSVPERLEGDGNAGVARSVASAAAMAPTAITLRTCANAPAWTLDGSEVTPTPQGRCTLRLDLGDHAPHELTLAADGDAVTQAVEARDIVVVSIGDSVASGEGNPDTPSALHPKWLERRCHRSMRSGAAQSVRALAAGDPHSSVTFLPLACSGATVLTGLLHPYRGVQPDARRGDLPAQVAELAKLAKVREIDAVLLSVGANDVYFGPLAKFCIFTDPCPQRRFDPEHAGREDPDRNTPTAEVRHARAQSELPGHYDEAALALGKAGIAPDRTIIVEYFDPTHDERGETCDGLLPHVSVTEAEWAAGTVLRPLNAEVRNAAQRHGWRLVTGVQEAFANHGICAKGQQAWVREIEGSLMRGSGLSGPLHPNSRGHLATSALISPVLAAVAGTDPGAAVAQTAGTSDNEAGGVAWWWLLVAATGGAILALVVQRIAAARRR